MNQPYLAIRRAAIPPESSGYRHFKLWRHIRADLVQIQRCAVAENALGTPLAVACPEIGRIKIVLQEWRRKVFELEDAARFPYPLSVCHIVRLELLRVAEFFGLGGREETPLRFNEPVELIEVGRLWILHIQQSEFVVCENNKDYLLILA